MITLQQFIETLGDAGVALVVVLGAIYEAAGILLPGWHTISYSAHRSWLVRGMILGAAASLPIILAIHFAQPIVK